MPIIPALVGIHGIIYSSRSPAHSYSRPKISYSDSSPFLPIFAQQPNDDAYHAHPIKRDIIIDKTKA